MKVFSKKKFFEADLGNCAAYCRWEDIRKWADESDGKPIIRNHCNGRYVRECWTEDVYNPVEETGKILNAHFPKGFPKGIPWGETVNCRCTVLTEKPAEHPKYEIIIKCTGDLTYAQMYVNDELVKTEFARRNPADKFNWRIGAQTAFNRLWEKKKKPVVKEVKRHAKSGEWVKVVAADSCHGETYKTGDVLKVKREWGMTDTDGWVFLEGHEGCVCEPNEYVVLEGYKPE